MTTFSAGRLARSGRWEVILMALISYVPLLFTQRGQIGADTKPYLYLDPGGLLADAPYLWQNEVGLGTVPHQNIGYLWPMGPYYWVMEVAGFPDWVAQRLWIGTTILLAGLGMRWLLRTMGWRHGGVVVAMLAYALTPYGLAYYARISALLLPWSGLPWMIGLAIRSDRSRGWRHPALFALVALTIGSVNATSLLLIGLGPVMWLLYIGIAEQRLKSIVAPALRIGVLTAATGLWWVIGVRTQGANGPPVLRFTETYEAVADSSTAPEVLRGLGYWFFYGNDHLGQWVEPSRAYTARTIVLILSFGLPILALLFGAIGRWRHRGFFVGLIVIGALISIGGHPFDAPSLLGGWFIDFTRTDAGLALRSTPRAVPLVVLGTSVLLGGGAAAVVERLPRAGSVARVGLAVLVIANMAPLFNGQMVARYLQRPEQIPEYWLEAVSHLDAGDHGTRILEVPGADFSSYRWGNTVEPVTPGLTDRPYVARELVPFGSEPSIDLLLAFDRGFQEGLYDTDYLAPIARLLGVGDVALRSDLQYERFRTPRPVVTWADLLATPGLTQPVGFGPSTPNIAGPEQPMRDEIALALPDDLEHPPAVAVFEVEDPLAIVRARGTDRPLLLAGDGSGLVDLAALGLYDADQMVVYAATAVADQAMADQMLAAGADLIITDTNRRQARRWGTIRENTGYIERADEEPLRYDPGDYRLVVVPGTDAGAQTVSVQTGGRVQATNYGNPVSFTVDNRPSLALDGDPDTAWRVGAFADVTGEYLRLDFDEPNTIDEVTLVQPLNGFRNRWITEVEIRLDDETVFAPLDDSSRLAAGQTIPVPNGSYERIEIEVVDTNVGVRDRYNGLSGVGLAELSVAGFSFDESIRLPTDLDQVDDTGHRVGFVVTRLRSDPQEPVRFDGEERLDRTFTVGSDRAFGIVGEARLSAYISDDVIDEFVGVESGAVAVWTSERLAGDLASRGRSAVDADEGTAWQTGFDDPTGEWIELEFGTVRGFEELSIRFLADGDHSVPTKLRVSTDGGEPIEFPVPEIADLDEPGATVEVALPLTNAIAGERLRIEIAEVRPHFAKDWYSGNGRMMPVGIAEIRQVAAPVVLDDRFDTGCRSDLLALDGEPVAVRITGTTEDALARRPLDLELCDPALALSEGVHRLTTTGGRTSGLDIDRLALLSNEDGSAAVQRPVDASATPTLTVENHSATSMSVDVDAGAGDDPFWFVLGQSYSDGWKATIDGVDLGPPMLVDGYANGWLVDGAAPGARIELRWTPQRLVWFGLAFSLAAVFLCALLAWRGRADPGVVTADAPMLEFTGRSDPEAGAAPRSTTYVFAGAALVTGFALVNLPRWHLAAVLVGAAYALARSFPRWRRVPALVAAALLLVSGAYTTVAQYRHRFPPDFGWPQFFDAVHVLGVLCVLFLAADAAVAIAERRRRTAQEQR